VYILAS